MESDVPLTRDAFVRRMADPAFIGADVSRETLARLDVYAETLCAWQPRINLVSNRSLDDLWCRHFLDSAQLARWVGPGSRVLDMGSGAGFPGLVLAIVTGARVVLAESDSRKCAFLREVRRLTDAPADIVEGRIEDLSPEPYDVVTARALAALEVLLGHAERFLGNDGFCLFLKGAKAEHELTDAAKVWNMETERHQSLSEPGGAVLRIRSLSRV